MTAANRHGGSARVVSNSGRRSSNELYGLDVDVEASPARTVGGGSVGGGGYYYGSLNRNGGGADSCPTSVGRSSVGSLFAMAGQVSSAMGQLVDVMNRD